MAYGELGRFPLGIYNYVKHRIINYWAILLTGKQEKTAEILFIYSILNNRTNIPWLKSVKSILDECGLSYVWNNQYFVSGTCLVI
jgi:hypothetical protein